MSTRTERQGDKALNEKHLKILKDMMKKPENRKCVDCRKRDPRWASWNLGIFMCIRCSGIHRSLGTHITKVKSADLDTWTVEQIENMQKWGNYKANLYWEKDWPSDSEPPESTIEQWIRAKYERKQYTKGPVPDPDTLPGFGETVVAKPEPNLISVPAPIQSQAPPAQATQQLFAAFGAPQVQQKQEDVKKNILSLYSPAANTSPTKPAFGAFPPQAVNAQPGFASFGSFAPATTTSETTPGFASFPQPPSQSVGGPTSGFASFAPPSKAVGGATSGFASFGQPSSSSITTPAPPVMAKDPFAAFSEFASAPSSVFPDSKPPPSTFGVSQPNVPVFASFDAKPLVFSTSNSFDVKSSFTEVKPVTPQPVSEIKASSFTSFTDGKSSVTAPAPAFGFRNESTIVQTPAIDSGFGAFSSPSNPSSSNATNDDFGTFSSQPTATAPVVQQETTNGSFGDFQTEKSLFGDLKAFDSHSVWS